MAVPEFPRTDPSSPEFREMRYQASFAGAFGKTADAAVDESIAVFAGKELWQVRERLSR